MPNRRGHSKDGGELVLNMIAIAVPIRGSGKRLPGTAPSHAPTSRVHLEEARRFLPRLQAAARALFTLVGDAGN